MTDLPLEIKIAIGVFLTALALLSVFIGLKMLMDRLRTWQASDADAEATFERSVTRGISATAPDQARAMSPIPAPASPDSTAAPPAAVIPKPAPPPSEEFKPATAMSAVRSLEQRLDIAGLLASPGEPVAIPGLEDKGRVVKLRNQKTMLLIPEGAAEAWIQSQGMKYDYLCAVTGSGARVIRRFEDFLAEMLFR